MKTLSLAAAVSVVLAGTSYGHGLIQDPPSRNWFCGAVTKPDHVLNGVAQYPVCGGAFAQDFSGGYSFMSVLTHAQGRSVVKPLPENVCGFNSETWQGRSTPWDQPIDWPTTNISAGERTFSWNISWGSHFSDTKEFRYWITKPGFQFQVGRPLSWTDFEDNAFCSLEYDDANPSGSPNVTPDKARAMFHTRCTVPQRQGRHVIYAEWGRNHYTFERFHSCVDVVFGAAALGFTLSASQSSLNVKAGQSATATITVNRTGGFTSPVNFTVNGLPAGVTAAFNPSSAGASTMLTLTASSAASLGAANITVTGTSGSLTGTVPITLNVAGQGQFSLSTSPGTLSLTQGSSSSRTIAIARTGDFSAAVAFSATGLPTGVTASFAPSSASGDMTTLTLNASASAATGPAAVVVSGTGDGLSQTVSISLTVNPQSQPTFNLSTSPESLTISQGSSGSASIAINRLNGFTSPVTFSASQLPAGITASFNPSVASGASTMLTLTAASSAITGGATALVTGTSGSHTSSIPVPFTVNATSAPGQVSITPRVNVNQPWYNEVAVQMASSSPITALKVTVTIQKTTGIGYAGQYNTIGGQIQQSNRSTDNAVIYEYVLAPGQTIAAGSYRIFAAQASGNGTAHPVSGDKFEVTYTIGGTNFTQTGKF